MVRDECGAPEFFSGGARLILMRGAHGKINAEALAARARVESAHRAYRAAGRAHTDAGDRIWHRLPAR